MDSGQLSRQNDDRTPTERVLQDGLAHGDVDLMAVIQDLHKRIQVLERGGLPGKAPAVGEDRATAPAANPPVGSPSLPQMWVGLGTQEDSV